ncbi:MAG: type IIL restriction-modification enzyme MmeI [Pirellula sp.]
MFGVLTSTMHMAWMRLVAGRLESRHRYSAKLVYNNFPWPQNPTDKQKANVEAKAQPRGIQTGENLCPSDPGGARRTRTAPNRRFTHQRLLAYEIDQ